MTTATVTATTAITKRAWAVAGESVTPEALATARTRQAELRAEVTDIQARLKALKEDAETHAWPEESADYRAYAQRRAAAVAGLDARKLELRDLRRWLEQYGPPMITISPDLVTAMLALVDRLTSGTLLTDDELATLAQFKRLDRVTRKEP